MANHSSSDDKKYLFDNPKNVKRLLYIVYACCAILVLLEFVIHRHIYMSWEKIFAFYPIYGFVGCVLLVLVAKWMRTFLMRDEDYYDKLDAEQHPKPANKADGDDDHNHAHSEHEKGGAHDV